MARKARSPVAFLRKLLLAVLVLCVAGLAGLFMFGKAGLRRDPPSREGETKGGKNMTLIGEDFDYTFTEGERPIFHIKGESVKADREGTLYLEGVALTMYDKDGRVFHVESRRASFNRESNEGVLQGDVVLKGPEDAVGNRSMKPRPLGDLRNRHGRLGVGKQLQHSDPTGQCL